MIKRKIKELPVLEVTIEEFRRNSKKYLDNIHEQPIRIMYPGAGALMTIMAPRLDDDEDLE